ncbi:hypothetical protein FALCPG4_014377 [Fusarium falciforme]
MMDDAQGMCGCGKPDVTVFETCLRCGNAVSFEELRQRAVGTYDKDDQPIEDPGLPRRHSLMKDPKRCLRLLYLNDSTSHVLSGRFEPDWIHRVRPYEAVSYTWGGEDGDYTKTEFILIDGKLFPITKNCAAVLHKIRKPGGTRAIWIDSLCINQNDVNERSVQVSQMGKIFSGAQKVHIYIGNNIDDRTASNAFHVLSEIRNLSEFNTRLSVRKDREQAIKTLFAQTYFSRMWIIQEVLLAKTAELHWGTANIPWQTFNKDHLNVLRNGIDDYIPDWMRIRATAKNFRNPETLGELLFSAMGSTASNDRDKVYGIYGLLLDAEEEGLKVDYSLSVKQVFTNMAVHLITKHNAIRAVLLHANHDAPLVDGEQLPSWVPDFRSRCVPKNVSISFGEFGVLRIHSTISSENVVSNIGTDELYLRGHRLGIFQRWRNARDEHSRVVRCEIGGQDLEWEIRAKFSVGFDPEEHIVFWMSNGLILHLKRSATGEDTYTFLGECVLKHSGPFPTLVVHNRLTSFADAMFGLELQDLACLWKIYMHLEGFFVRTKQKDVFTTVGPTWANMKETREAASEYRDFCSQGDFNEYTREFYRRRRKNTARRWMFGFREVQKPNYEETFGRDDYHDDEMFAARWQVGSQMKRMFDFEFFWWDPGTWERLHSLKTVLQHPESYDIQKINELCGSWLRHYDKTSSLMQRFKVDRKRTLGTQVLEELKVWETATEKLSEVLQWAEEFFWPEEPHSAQVPSSGSDDFPMLEGSWSGDEDNNLIPPVSEETKAPIVNNDNEDSEVRDNNNGSRKEIGSEGPNLLSDDFAGMLVGDRGDQVESAKLEGVKPEQSETEGGKANGSSHGNKMMPDWVIKNNFKVVRLRWNELEAGKGGWRPDRYVLEPWSDGWAEAIWSIPHLFTVKDQVNLEELFQLEERCVKRGAWRGTKMEIFQAETITLV